MELKCLEVYGSAQISLVEGETTVGKEVSEEKKAQMLADYPEKFEIYEGTEEVTPDPVEEPEPIIEEAPVEEKPEGKPGKKGK